MFLQSGGESKTFGDVTYLSTSPANKNWPDPNNIHNLVAVVNFGGVVGKGVG